MAWLPFFEARFSCSRSSALAPLAIHTRGSFLRRSPNPTDAFICPGYDANPLRNPNPGQVGTIITIIWWLSGA